MVGDECQREWPHLFSYGLKSYAAKISSASVNSSERTRNIWERLEERSTTLARFNEQGGALWSRKCGHCGMAVNIIQCPVPDDGEMREELFTKD